MKTFAEISHILHEAKFKIASGEKELSKETAKVGGEESKHCLCAEQTK